MDESNFGIDENGRTVLMDFAEIGVLPETFIAFTMPSSIRLHPVAAPLSLSYISDVQYSMARIRTLLWMKAEPSLGALTWHRYKIAINEHVS
jgi:hypothetical protein